MSKTDHNRQRLNKKGNRRGMSDGSKAGQVKKGEAPKHTKGRGAGALNRKTRLGIVRKVLGKYVVGEVDGKKQRIPLTEAVLLRYAQDALKGDKSAMAMILKLWEQSEEEFERERESEYPFDENDRKMIESTYKRMMDCLDPFS